MMYSAQTLSLIVASDIALSNEETFQRLVHAVYMLAEQPACKYWRLTTGGEDFLIQTDNQALF